MIKAVTTRFIRDEEGAVTVDFVILTAALAVMALGAIAVIVAEGTQYGDLIAGIISSVLRS
ncbi:hypothetical protein [Gemmobacter caeruleus]|uniref:hypothetical protein n=1 Tax=Gemmobacter caeruleus TaxID=2595004 RepID=UPI0011EDDF9B|nr:hypothetical protein [Gemmobacter caeruleus]